jgi:hypothetical protein
LVAAIAAHALLVRAVRANGEAEYVAPLDRPVSSSPERPLPYAIAEEQVARGAPPLALEGYPTDLTYLTTPNLSAGKAISNALGHKRQCFESVVVRGSTLKGGKLTIPAGGLSYVAESSPLTLPFQQDALCIAGTEYTLVDFEQTIVTRKAVTLAPSEATVLGSEVFRFRSVTEFGNARSAVIEVSSLGGFDWARLGTGSLEVSTTEPGWHAKTFHYGLHQGRVEEVTPKSVRFAWLSGLRTDWVLLAGKREASGKVVVDSEVKLAGGGRIRVLRVDPNTKQVDIETPEGRKTLSVAGDLRNFPADTALRRKLIARGADFAVVLVPDASDFPSRQVHLEVYSALRQYAYAAPAPDDNAYKTYPMAHYTGGVLGVQWVNTEPLEISAANPVLKGPYATFKLAGAYKASELDSVVLEDPQGAQSGTLAVSGRNSLNLVTGAGPTLDSIMARAGVDIATSLHALWSSAATSRTDPKQEQPKANAPAKAPPAPTNRWLELARTTPGFLWALAGLAIGLLLGYLVGRAGRRVIHSWE